MRTRRGLGEVICTQFAKEGANIAVNYFNRVEPAEKVAKACEEHGVKSVVVKAVCLFYFSLWASQIVGGFSRVIRGL